jgi:hypothetical protein
VNFPVLCRQAIPALNVDGSINAGAVCFVCSFVVIINWTLLQICVAVLLDTFVSTRQMREDERMQENLDDLVAQRTIHSALDPLLGRLVKEYTDDADLSRRLHELFEVNFCSTFVSCC